MKFVSGIGTEGGPELTQEQDAYGTRSIDQRGYVRDMVARVGSVEPERSVSPHDLNQPVRPAEEITSSAAAVARAALAADTAVLHVADVAEIAACCPCPCCCPSVVEEGAEGAGAARCARPVNQGKRRRRDNDAGRLGREESRGDRSPVAGADLRASLVVGCLRGAFPPVDLRAVCFVHAIGDGGDGIVGWCNNSEFVIHSLLNKVPNFGLR
jgi:hypothetical protein